MSLEGISKEDKKLIIIDFLGRCNQYSDEMVEGYKAKLLNAEKLGEDVTHQKIDKWVSYREFNEYAIGELQGKELDSWF